LFNFLALVLVYTRVRPEKFRPACDCRPVA
jgi:hypothetical protein